MKNKEELGSQICIRLPSSLLRKVDAIADMSEGPSDPRWAAVEGQGKQNRSDILRLGVEKGLDLIERYLADAPDEVRQKITGNPEYLMQYVLSKMYSSGSSLQE
jgi:hypothetical protein